MTQAGGNGHNSDVDSDDITVYEPASLPESGEPIGWYETDPTGEDGEFTPELPPELDDDDDESSN